MRILLQAPILTQSGYGEHSRLVFESLKHHGDVFLSPLQWGKTAWKVSEASDEVIAAINKQENYIEVNKKLGKEPEYDIQVHVGIANEFQKKAPYSVLVTAGIETDRVSPNWLIKTHEGIDKIIVPSQHAAAGFENTTYQVTTEDKSGNREDKILRCNCPVEVVPYPAKHFEKLPEPLDLNLKTDFNFLTIALLGPRKNIENQIKWFMEEFKDDPNVGLILKTSLAKSSIIDRRNTRAHITKIMAPYKTSKCKLYLLHGSMTEPEVNSLYVHPKVNAYLTTSHGEGYGLPIFEAAYNGLPIVATDWSGHLDFLSGKIKQAGKMKAKKLFCRIDYALKEIPENAVWKDILHKGSKWAYPLEISAKRQMRNMFKNSAMYTKWAKSLKDQIHVSFEESHVKSAMAVAILSEPKQTTTPIESQALVL